jgi:hypothetical protein
MRGGQGREDLGDPGVSENRGQEREEALRRRHRSRAVQPQAGGAGREADAGIYSEAEKWQLLWMVADQLVVQLTQAQLADLVGVKPAHLSDREKGRRPIGTEMAKWLPRPPCQKKCFPVALSRVKSCGGVMLSLPLPGKNEQRSCPLTLPSRSHSQILHFFILIPPPLWPGKFVKL